MSDLVIHNGPAPRLGEVVLQETYPSRLDLKEGIVATFLDAVSAPDWVVEDERYWMQLCLEEVVVNGMLHGNEGDPRLPVVLELREHGDEWILLVSDRGDGFCLEDLPDLDDPESLLLEHGRGITLMLGWLTELSYYDGGSTAYLRRTKGAAEIDSETEEIE